MTFRRFLIAFGGLLVLFLSLYTWNRNSHVLDKAASSLGLEAVGFLIEPLRDAEDACTAAWRRYVDLVSVREENEVLKAKVRELARNMNTQVFMATHERAVIPHMDSVIDLN